MGRTPEASVVVQAPKLLSQIPITFALCQRPISLCTWINGAHADWSVVFAQSALSPQETPPPHVLCNMFKNVGQLPNRQRKSSPEAPNPDWETLVYRDMLWVVGQNDRVTNISIHRARKKKQTAL